MANVVIPLDEYRDSFNIVSVKVPASTTYDDGSICVATTLSTVTGEGDTYASTVTTAVDTDHLVMVVGDEYYEDSNGNRINITDPTEITYRAGSVVRAYSLRRRARFAMSSGTYTGTPVVGEFLIPTANAQTWAAAAAIGTAKYALQVEAINQNITYTGLNAVTGVIARVVTGD